MSKKRVVRPVVSPVMLRGIVCMIMCICAGAPTGGRVFAESPKTVLHVTGLGKQPEGVHFSEAQKKLMAKRAAMLEAYKKLAGALGEAHSDIADGRGTSRVSGYIKGARLVEARYYDNGDVEVDVDAPVSRRAQSGGEDRPVSPRSTGKLVRVEREGEDVDWRKVLQGTALNKGGKP
jgi:hypothetical protein